ncbi:MAG: hypothetical protein AAF721_07160 [Myxococcota bacterium]
MRDLILESLETFLEGVFRIGGEGDLSVGAPLKVAPRGLPPGAADFFCRVSRRIAVRWHLDEDVGDALPEEFEECRFGQLELHPKCFEPVTAEWSASDDPVWADKIVFAPDGSGDYLGIDARSRVVYLSHDLAEPHGRRLAKDLTDLMLRWAPLGCVGPSGAALEPFLTKTQLSPKGRAARRFLSIVGGTSRNWKSAKRARNRARAKQTKRIEADPTGTYAKFIASVTDRELDEDWGPFHTYAVEMIGKCYGRAPSGSLESLVKHSPGKEVGSFTPMPPGGAMLSWDNAFALAQADPHLLCGAFTNTWPVGGGYLVEVHPETHEVSRRTPLSAVVGVSESLPAFAQRVALEQARRNTDAGAEEPAPRTRASALAEEAALLIALFGKAEAWRQLPAIAPQPLPDDLDKLDGATALRRLWLSYLSGAELSLDGAHRHPAQFVSHAAAVIESLLPGGDVRNPANYIHLARQACCGKSSWPSEHDDARNFADMAHDRQEAQRWEDMLAIADEMIAGGFRLDHAWPYRVRALAGLGRHEDVLAAADTALLYCAYDSAAMFGAKVEALAKLGETEASEAHVWWCSPHYRQQVLER